MKIKQKDAVYQAITNVLTEEGVHFEDGMNVGPEMTKERRLIVSNVLVAGFQGGTIELDKEYETESALRSYVSGLISNWIRKDTRLNGNTKYVAKNPGSRLGASDDQLKALKALYAQTTSEADRAEIQGFIDQRVAELNASKVKKVEVNFEALPEALRSKFSK